VQVKTTLLGNDWMSCYIIVECYFQPPVDETDEEGLAGEDGVEEGDIVRFGLRTPKPWISLGSEFEVEEEMVIQTDEKVCI